MMQHMTPHLLSKSFFYPETLKSVLAFFRVTDLKYPQDSAKLLNILYKIAFSVSDRPVVNSSLKYSLITFMK